MLSTDYLTAFPLLMNSLALSLSGEKVWGKQADKSWVSSAQVTRLDFRLLFWFVNDILFAQSTARQRTKVRAARHSKIPFPPFNQLNVMRLHATAAVSS